MVDGVFSIPLVGRTSRSSSGSSGPEKEVALREFIAGPENRLVTIAVHAILEQGASHYNPILFYGRPGTGKSHLAWGIASVWKARYPRRPVLVTSAMELAQEWADAVDAQTVDDFRETYRAASLLVVEDLGMLAGKTSAQQELGDTIDSLADAGSWVVLTSSASPLELSGISRRLQSRLAAGLTVPLTLPTMETRMLIVRRLAQERKLHLPQEAILSLAQGLEGGVSELSGALLCLETAAQLDGGPIDAERVRRFLAERSEGRDLSLRVIASLTARHFSLKLAELQSASRSRAVVTARGIAMYLARTLTNHSLDQIGHYFGGRDHTTVSHGCRKTVELLEAEPAFRQVVSGLRDRLLKTA